MSLPIRTTRINFDLISSKTKGVYFVKQAEKVIPKEKFEEALNYGDLSQVPLEHLSSFVDDVVDGILSFQGLQKLIFSGIFLFENIF